MNILHVNSSFEPRNGGPYQATRGMCKALVMRGHQVTLYTTNIVGQGSVLPFHNRTQTLDMPTSQPVPLDGYEVWYSPVRWPSRWCFSPSLAQALARTVANYDIVHIHSLYLFPTQAAAYFCRKQGVPYIVRPHGTLNPAFRRRRKVAKWLYDFAFQRRDLDSAAAIHYTASEEMALAASVGIRSPGFVISLAVDIADLDTGRTQGAFRAEYLNGWNGSLVLFLGRINFIKGLDLLIPAFAEVCRRREDVRLAIIGYDNPPSYGAQVRRWVSEAGIGDRVVFTGPLFGEDKKAALADADLWVLPSYSENFGIAVVEAMACGLPVIISNKVNLHSDVARAGAGIVIDCDAGQLADAMLQLLDSPVERRRMGENGGRLTRRSFSLEALGLRLEQAYQEIIGGRVGRLGQSDIAPHLSQGGKLGPDLAGG